MRAMCCRLKKAGLRQLTLSLEGLIGDCWIEYCRRGEPSRTGAVAKTLRLGPFLRTRGDCRPFVAQIGWKGGSGCLQWQDNS